MTERRGVVAPTVAALFVEEGGVYFGLEGVDPWPKSRDARQYRGPLIWGPGPKPEAWISTDRPRAELAAAGIAQLSKKEAKRTPEEFRDLLLSLARKSRNLDKNFEKSRFIDEECMQVRELFKGVL